MELLYSCGLRRTELADLRIYDVDIKRAVLVVQEGKGGKNRVLPRGALKDTAYRWLDLKALLQKTLPKENSLLQIKYYTARVHDTPGNPNIATRKAIGLLIPTHRSKPKELSALASVVRHITPSALAQSQLPIEIPGTRIHKPREWYDI